MHQFQNRTEDNNNFKVMSYLGFWRPVCITKKWSICFYQLYSIIAFIFQYFYSFGFFINLCLNKHDSKVLIENMFFFSTSLLLNLKLSYVNIYRGDFISFLNMFLQKSNLPRNIEEVQICKKFQNKVRFTKRFFVISTVFTSTFYLFWPLTDRKSISLPLKSWTPYPINSRSIFWLTYVYQCVVTYLVSFLYTSFETLQISLMQKICAQLELLMSRLFEIPKLREKNRRINIYEQECNLVKDCVNHHVRIFSMEKKFNDIFSCLISLQFFVSVFNLCTSGFYLTKMNINNTYFWITLLMIFCFFFQIFVYCWFGEDITRKSLSVADKIYKMDWNSLSVPTKQKLIIIMIRANRPMQLTGSSLIVLSIETFFKVLKASYSSFNLLRNSN